MSDLQAIGAVGCSSTSPKSSLQQRIFTCHNESAAASILLDTFILYVRILVTVHSYAQGKPLQLYHYLSLIVLRNGTLSVTSVRRALFRHAGSRNISASLQTPFRWIRILPAQSGTLVSIFITTTLEVFGQAGLVFNRSAKLSLLLTAGKLGHCHQNYCS